MDNIAGRGSKGRVHCGHRRDNDLAYAQLSCEVGPEQRSSSSVREKNEIFRVIAASNVDPRRLVHDGKLRQDLYYRLSVMRIAVPPLRERVEDIPLLANLFLERLAPEGRPPKSLAPRALRLLISHDWPGNVRELQNVIERAALISQSDEISPGNIVLEEDDLDWHPEGEDSLAYEEAKHKAIERFQRRYVEELMAQADGNVSAAARKAAMTRAALYRILKRLGLASEDEDAEDEKELDSTRPGS